MRSAKCRLVGVASLLTSHFSFLISHFSLHVRSPRHPLTLSPPHPVTPSPLSTCRVRGFTLLEVLLATVLTAVLMTGLWTLLNTYQGLFSSGEAAAEQSQLVRTLLDQFSDDLHSAIPDSATGAPGASSSIRRFGLFGTERAIQVDVLQITPAQCVADLTARGEPASSPVSSPQVPELHTVQYWLEEPGAEGLEGLTASRGLVRRELDWETPASGTIEASLDAWPSGSGGVSDASGEGDAWDAADPMSVAPWAADREDASVFWAPEVTDLRFRYYDGSGWSTQWNSLERKSLPVAVEIAVTVRSGEETRPRAAPRLTEDIEEELALELGTPTEEAGRTHRLLVWLPSTGLGRRAPEQAETFASILEEADLPLLLEYTPVAPPRPAMPARTRPPTPALSPAPSPVEPGPRPGGRKALEQLLRDQWMRTGQ